MSRKGFGGAPGYRPGVSLDSFICRCLGLVLVPHPSRAQIPSRSSPLFARGAQPHLRAGLSASGLLLPPRAFGLVQPPHDDTPPTCIPMIAPSELLSSPAKRVEPQRSHLVQTIWSPRLLLTRNTGCPPEVSSARHNLGSRRPMQPRPDPWCRLVLAHLEHAPGGLRLGPHTPPGDEGAGECGVGEIDRHRVIEHAASPRASSPSAQWGHPV